jgi:hypothetical protein
MESKQFFVAEKEWEVGTADERTIVKVIILN